MKVAQKELGSIEAALVQMANFYGGLLADPRPYPASRGTDIKGLIAKRRARQRDAAALASASASAAAVGARKKKGKKAEDSDEEEFKEPVKVKSAKKENEPSTKKKATRQKK